MSNGHRIVPVSVDPFNEPEDDARFRCAGCGARGLWLDDKAFDRECAAPLLPGFEEAS